MSHRRGRRNRDRDQRSSSKKYEEKAIVLEVLTADMNRKKGRYSDEPILQVVGTSWFTLLEIIPENTNMVMLSDRITLSVDERDNIKTIVGRINYDDLTTIARREVEDAVEKILEEDEDRFVEWLNKSTPISLRLHSLHLIKGIGPKTLKVILDERKKGDFSSYDDFEDRTGIGDIKNLLKQRILDEITNEEEKNRLFTRGTPRDRR